MRKLIGLAAALLALALIAGSASAAGGPVILGGDDLTDHGSWDGTNNVDGWLYMEKAIANIKPAVTRANDNSIAAIGSSASTATSADAGAGIKHAADKNGMTVTYHDTAAQITAFFDALRAGTVKPRIIWISGDGASNDLCCDSAVITALNNNATTIGDFVNQGGGVMSHGSEYGWLFGLFPSGKSVDSGSSDDLVLTPDGTAAFPGLTNEHVNAGPWHSHFEGNLGTLKTLVRSTTVKDATGADARVIVGGAGVILPGSITLTPPTAQKDTGTTHVVTAEIRKGDGSFATGKTITFKVLAGGPNAGKTGTATSDANGKGTFSLTSATEGTDTIEGSFTDENGAVKKATATVTWKKGTTPPPPPPPPTKQATTLTAEPVVLNLLPGAAISLAAHGVLTDAAKKPIYRKKIVVSAGGTPVCESTTNLKGEYRCNGSLSGLLALVLGFGYDATFAGSATYKPSQAHAGIVRISGTDIM